MADENTQILQDILNALKNNNGANPSAGASTNTKRPDYDGSAESINKLKTRFDETAKQIFDANKGVNTWSKSIQQGLSPYGKYQEQVKQAKEELDKFSSELNELSTDQEKQAKKDLEAGLQKVETTARVNAATDLLNTSMGNLKNSTMNVAKSFAGLQTSGSQTDNIEQAAGMLKTAMNMAVDGITTLASSAALAASAIPIVGGAGNALANALQKGGELAKTAIGTAVDILTKELTRNITTYNQVSSAGLTFADGIKGMQKAAFSSGFTLEQFGKIVSENSGNFASSGLGMAAGTAKLNATFKAGGEQLRSQMMNLGYSFEEQGGLVADVMRDMAGRAGPLKAGDAEVAAQTAEYAENLRIISGITGEDAKAKMQQARDAANNLAFNQKLAGMEAGERAKITGAMANMNELQKKSFMEMMVFGSVINKEGAVMAASSAGWQGSLNESVANAKAGTLDAKKQAEIQGKWGEQTRKEILSNTALGAAGLANVGGVASAVAVEMNKMLTTTQQYNEGAVGAALKGAQDQAKTLDPLTQSVNKTSLDMQQMQADMSKLIGESGALEGFSKVLSTTTQSAMGVLHTFDLIAKGKINEVLDTKDKDGVSTSSKLESAGDEALRTGAIGAAVGTAILPGVGTAIGGAVGALGGALIGWFNAKEGHAIGGIASGPEEGFITKLHGTELVLPLTSDRRIKQGTNGYNALTEIIQKGPSFDTSAASAATNLSAEKPDTSSMFSNFSNLASSLVDMVSNPISTVINEVSTLTDSTPANNAPNMDFNELVQKFTSLEKAFNQQLATSKETNDILNNHSDYLRNILRTSQ